MAPDGYLRGILGDGARPVRHRSGVRELLGVPNDGARVVFLALPRGGFVYRRTAGGPAPARAAAEAEWQVLVVDDPSDPWPDEPPAAPVRHDGRSRSVAPVPPVTGTATSAGPAVSRPITPDGFARPAPGGASSPAPVATDHPGGAADGVAGPPDPKVVTIPGVTQAARRPPTRPLGAPTPPSGAPAPVRDALPDPPRAAGPASAGPPPAPAPGTPAGGGPARSPAVRRLPPVDGPLTTDPPVHPAPPAPVSNPEPAPPVARPASLPAVPESAGQAPATAHGADPTRWSPPRAAPAVEELRPRAVPHWVTPRRVTSPGSAPLEAVPATRSDDVPRRPHWQPTSLAPPVEPVDAPEPPAAAPGPPPAPPVVIVPSEPAGPAAFWERRHVGRLRARIPR